jgi:DNA-binding transcriptional LysR family regulator
VELSLLEDNSDRLVEGVRAATIDLALIGTASATLDGLDALTIISERLVVAVPAGHPLAKQRRVTLRDLGHYPLVCMPPGTGLRTVFDQACAAQGLRPVIALQASAVDAIADLAIRGLAVAILSDSMAARYRDRLTALIIDDVKTPARLALIWKTTQSPAVRELLVHSRTAFAKPEPRKKRPR